MPARILLPLRYRSPSAGHDEGPDFPVFSRRVGAFDLAVTVGFELKHLGRAEVSMGAFAA